MLTRLLTIIILLFSVNAFSQCSDFSDNFETGTYSPTWSSTGGMTPSVTTTSPATGIYRLEGSGGTTNHLDGLFTNFTNATPSEMSWWIYPVGTSNSVSYFVAGNNSVSATNCIVFCFFHGPSGNIRFISDTDLNFAATPNNWYHIELKNINWTNHEFDVHINGIVVATAFPFRSTLQNYVSTVHLYNYVQGQGVWDDIRIGTAPVTFSTSITQALCFSDTNGSIDLTATSTNAGALTYLWSNGTTTEDVNNLAAGSYDVLITDSQGCTESVTNIVVTEPAELTATVSTYNTLCSYSSDGTASIFASGGTGTYTYSWSNIQSADSISGLAAGTYYCTIEDLNGCQYEDSAVIVTPLPIAVQSVVTNPVSCGGQEGAVNLTVSNGVPGYDFDWSNGELTEDLSGVSAGIYSFVITDANGCTYADSVTLVDPVSTTVTFSLPFDTLCTYHNAVTLSGAVPLGGVYSGNGVTGSQFDPAQTGSGMQVIVYTYTDANSCISIVQDTLSVDACLGMEVKETISFSLWPNPAIEYTILTSDVKLDRVIITSLSGQILQTIIPTSSNPTIDLSNIGAGTYLVVLEVSGKQFVQKLVHQ